ncbi:MULTISPECIES: DUF4145 domain-containing protein [Nostocales]|jgi:hypothetical protein|uniref:DUF4145 domain-containing protein n=1 Tax=Dolichospermum flos-aquae UHCC 0037 TaxID=2590026 RepID=A0ACC7S4Q8_DOLFA|nr:MULTISPECIES: DUF4145 domain-containing protein [Nostocales]MBO1064508.1 DUF4145 domain-containing protein [Anabaena sp. 54]MTJ43349.1 DUF4145 domain-containing protein [Dolichospermum flos-aquae UHCC 0037]
MSNLSNYANSKAKARCNNCRGEVNHDILHEIKVPDGEVYYSSEFWETKRYAVLRCCGCENVIFRLEEDSADHGWPTYYYYPPYIHRQQPIWLNKYSRNDDLQDIRSLMKEIYAALHANCIKLATMGIRALIEHIMIKKVGDNKTFTKNLDEFANQGYISNEQKKIITAVIEAGNATIHRSYSPSLKELENCMDIAENLIETIFIHSNQAKTFSEKIPPRPSKSNDVKS